MEAREWRSTCIQLTITIHDRHIAFNCALNNLCSRNGHKCCGTNWVKARLVNRVSLSSSRKSLDCITFITLRSSFISCCFWFVFAIWGCLFGALHVRPRTECRASLLKVKVEQQESENSAWLKFFICLVNHTPRINTIDNGIFEIIRCGSFPRRRLTNNNDNHFARR